MNQLRTGLRVPTLQDRASGILLHPTSLPGPNGAGDIGHAAHEFADWLASAGQRWWQMLPVGPVGYGNSPYSAQSAFAGSPVLVSLDGLVQEGLLTPAEVDETRKSVGNLSEKHVHYASTGELRERCLR